MVVLDALRKQRNVADYSGDVISEAAMTECISQAENLYSVVQAWWRDHDASSQPESLISFRATTS